MIVGIDLGTTFSAISYINKDGEAELVTNRDGERTTPSVVMFEDGAIVVGESAKENSVVDPYNVCQFVKRKMGQKSFSFELSSDESYTAEDISAMILKRMKEDAEAAAEESIEGAVITVPAYFDDAQRKATQDAGNIAGLNVMGIINEPTAAAIAYCHGHANSAGKIMVFDLGGGTFDITIMSVNDDLTKVDILSTTGNRNLGGFDFDNILINRVLKEYKDKYRVDLDDDDVAFQDLRLKAETAKKALSARPKATVSVVSNGKPIKVEITRDDFEKGMQNHLLTMQGSMEIALEDAKLKWKDIDKILLVGGSTRIPCIQNMIEKVSGIKPSKELNPDEAVAMGAAYYAANLKRKAKGGKTGDDVEIVDVNSHSLGVISRDKETGRLVNSVIIPKNTPIPTVELNAYGTVVDNQESIKVVVLEGEDEDPEYCTRIGEAEMDIPPMPKGSVIVIAMSYNEDGMVNLMVFNGETKDVLGVMEIERESNLTKEQVNRKARRMSTMEVE